MRPFVPSQAAASPSHGTVPLAPPLKAAPSGSTERVERIPQQTEELPWLTGSTLKAEAPKPAVRSDSLQVDEVYSRAREVDLSEDEPIEWGRGEAYGEIVLPWGADSRDGLEEEEEEDEDPFDDLVRETDLNESSAEEGLMDEPPEFPPAGSESRRVEEIAVRLERIARSLRERGLSGPLAEQGTDPLGALITGYLLGVSESAERHDSPPEA